MTRKDYVMIAKAIADTRGDYGNLAVQKAIDNIAYALANDFAADNPRFDYDRFVKACRVNLAD